MRFHLATVAWNAAILPEEKRQAMLDEMQKIGMPGFSEDGQEDPRALLAKMVERKLVFFGENKRFILSIELTGAERGYHLSVVSTPGKS